EGADRDADHGDPVDPIVADDDVGARRDGVDDEDEHVLQPVEPLQIIGQEQTEQGDEDDALGRGEVAAVDGGEEDDEQHGQVAAGRESVADGGVFDTGLVCPAQGALLEIAGQVRLADDHDQGYDEEDGHDRLEGVLGQVEQQIGSGQGPQQGRGDESEDPPPLAAQLVPVAERGGDVAGDEPDG